jgi:mannose-1-phosphate guanylyltransferase/mannose-6-phosphate isomerase
MIPVILSGGSGSRLWPRSRKAYPKQFLPLVNSETTMIQQTALRLAELDTRAPVVVCNEEHRFMVAEQLTQIAARPDAILLEPCGRNTAPAVCLAALHALTDRDDELLLILPADHVIQDIVAFHSAVNTAVTAARNGHLVTFGIVPNRPETGYGYIHRGSAIPDLSHTFEVGQFVEKPDEDRARAFIEDGSYFWNSGMFLFSAARYVEELQRFNPEMVKQCRAALQSARHDLDFTWVDSVAFTQCPEDSIDYAVMEKTAAAAVVPLDAGWSDVGSWQSLWDIRPKDGSGNSCDGEIIAIDSTNCIMQGEKRLIAAIGVSDLVIVDSDDALLVAHRDRTQDVKKVVKKLEEGGCGRHLTHRKVFRPWGHYDAIDQGPGFQVKRITVKPGQRLSLQLHHHRAEHWVVVRGTAKVTCGDSEFILSENESTFIPLGTRHRLENPGKVDLEIIEVQSGSYLGEDDIVRFDDAYGRVDS